MDNRSLTTPLTPFGEKMLSFIRTVQAYTAPWAVEEVMHPEVFRKAMLNINEDATKLLKEMGHDY